MSQYNKTVLTYAGLELAKRANAGQAKFGITRAVTSADDWSNKTVQDLEEVTTIPNIMQQGTIMDTDEVESNNSVIGVSLCFTNKNLSTGYQIRIIGLYVKEEGQEDDFLYAVTTAVTPEYMPDFNDKVLYRFNMQMYLVIGNAQSVNVVINDGTAVTHRQLDKYKGEVAANLEKIENAHKEDMSHVVKSASINGGDEILPDEAGKLNLVVPDPDLSKYVSLEQLGELLKANISDVYTKSDIDSALAVDRGRLGKLEGTQTLDSPDFNSITATGVYYITNNTPANIKNNPASPCGVLVVSNGNGNRISQVYYPDDGSPQWCRLLNESNWLPWYQLSTKKDVSNAINKFDLSKVKFRKRYINSDGQTADKTWSATKNDDGTYTIDLYNDDWTASKLADVLAQLPNKADTSALNTNVTQLQNSKLNFKYISDGYDLLSADGFWGVMEANNAQNLQNLPNGIKNKSRMYVLKLFKDNWGTVIINQDNCIWVNYKNGARWYGWMSYAHQSDVNDLRNQVQQLIDNQFEVQTFTDATAAANWEAQKPGHRMAIIQS